MIKVLESNNRKRRLRESIDSSLANVLSNVVSFDKSETVDSIAETLGDDDIAKKYSSFMRSSKIYYFYIDYIDDSDIDDDLHVWDIWDYLNEIIDSNTISSDRVDGDSGYIDFVETKFGRVAVCTGSGDNWIDLTSKARSNIIKYLGSLTHAKNDPQL